MNNKTKIKTPVKSKEIALLNKRVYNKEYKELKFLVETKKADDFTINMYVAFVAGRKITPKMLESIRKIIKRNSPEEKEKKRLEIERLIPKINLIITIHMYGVQKSF